MVKSQKSSLEPLLLLKIWNGKNVRRRPSPPQLVLSIERLGIPLKKKGNPGKNENKN